MLNSWNGASRTFRKFEASGTSMTGAPAGPATFAPQHWEDRARKTVDVAVVSRTAVELGVERRFPGRGRLPSEATSTRMQLSPKGGLRAGGDGSRPVSAGVAATLQFREQATAGATDVE